MNRFLRKAVLAAGFIFSTLAGYSQFATYTFTTNTNPNSSPTGVTNGNFSIGSSVVLVNTSTTYKTTDWTTMNINTGGNNYYQVIITPAAGVKIDFSTFVFDMASSDGTGGGNHGGPDDWTLRSSADGFGSSLDGGTGFQGNSFTNRSANISALTNITSAITFRIFMGNAEDNQGVIDLDNVKISGTISMSQPTVMTFTGLLNNGTGYTVGWTAPATAPVGYIAVRKAGSTPTRTAATPVDGTVYTVGTALLGGNVAYVGTSASFSETTLTAATDYYYDIYPYNGAGAGTYYIAGAAPSPLAGNRFTLAVEPSVQASDIVFSALNPGAGTMTVSWTNGTNPGNTRILIGKDGSAVDYVPVDGAPVPGATANLDITAGGSSVTGFATNHLIATGAGSSANVTGLVAGHTYYFRVYEFNGSATTTDFITSTANDNPHNTEFEDQATGISFANTTNTTTDVSFTNGSAAGRIVVARATSAINAEPVNGVSYPVNPFGTVASEIGTGNFVVANATGNTVTGLSPNTNYFFRVYERDASNNYVHVTATGNDNTINVTTTNEPANHVTAFAAGAVTSSVIPLSWTGSSGSPAPASYLLVARDVTTGTFPFFTVADNTAPTADQPSLTTALAAKSITFGTNSYNGWTNLVAGHRYDFIIYPYITGSVINPNADYKIASAPTLTVYTEPALQATGLNFTNVFANSFDVNYTAEASASGYVVLRSTVALPTGTPTDGVQYTAGGTIGSDDIVYVGTGVTFPQTGLTPSTTYYYRVFAYSGLATSPNYLLGSPLGGNQATTAPAATGTLVATAAGIANISSLTVTQGASHALATSFDFVITDDAGAGGDLSRTKISDITINLDGLSTITSLSSTLAAGPPLGAELWDGTANTPLVATSITGSTIVFNGIPNADGELGDIADNQPKTYSLRIWLSSTMAPAFKAVVDGQKFVFNVTDANVVTIAGSSTLAATQTAQSNTASNVVQVAPTELRFVSGSTPSNTFLLATMSTVLVEATDTYGNRDRGTGTTIGLTSTGTLLSAQSALFSLGLGTYSGIVHNAAGTGLTMTTTDGTLTNPVSGTFNITASSASNIKESTFTYPTNIQYETLQATDIDISGSSINVAKFELQDGGNSLTDTDNAPTILTQLVLTITNPGVLRRIALYDDLMNEIAEQPVSGGTVTFSGLTITAPEGGFKQFFVRVSFKSAVTDNTQITFTTAATCTTQATGSSGLAATNAGAATTTGAAPINTIEVTATKLEFVQQPTNVVINATMTPSPTVIARDALNNTDVDFISNVPLTSSGSLASAQSATFASGLGTYSTIVHNASGTNVTLTASFGALTDAVSSNFQIIANSSDINVDTGFPYPQNFAYETYQENVDITGPANGLLVARFELRDGGGSADGDNFPTILTNLSLNLGANYTFVRRIALYNGAGAIELPGTAEQAVSSPIVSFSGLNLTANDDGLIQFTVRASFTQAVTDGQHISFKLNSATALASVSSQFAAPDAGGGITSVALLDNRLNVTATQLKFLAQPANTLNGVTQGVSVQALDGFNQLDTDFGSTVNLVSTGVMTGSPQSALFISGLGLYPNIVHTTNATGLTLATTSGTLTNVASSAFNITSSNQSDIIANTGFGYTSDINYLTFNEGTSISTAGTALNVAKFDIRDGGLGGDSDVAPTIVTSVALDLGANFAFFKRVALFDATGATKIGADIVVGGSPIINFTGLNFTAPDAGPAFSFIVRASFTNSVVDNQQFTITINSTTTQANTSSTFPTPAAGAAVSSTTGNINKIEVTADRLIFTSPAHNLTSPKLPNVDVSSQQTPNPQVRAVDVFNNLDLDYATAVNITCAIGTSTITLTRDNPAPNAGVYTFPTNFRYLVTGNGQLQFNTGGFATLFSNAVSVQAGAATKIALGVTSLSPTISSSSVASTSAQGVATLYFDVTDDQLPTGPGNDDGLPTLITGLTVTAGPTNNSISDWTQAIAGATLVDLQGHSIAATAILTTPNRIVFTGIPVATDAATSLGYIDDSSTKQYTLKVYLKTALGGSLPTTIDGLGFEFEVKDGNFALAGNSTTFVGSQSATSGAANVVDVTATTLKFISPASASSASLNAPFAPIAVEAVDINGNRDLNFTGAASTIRSLTNVAGSTTNAAAVGLIVGTTQFASGLYTFPGTFQFTSGTNGAIVTLSIAAGLNSSCGSNYSTGGICATSPTITLLASSESWIKQDPLYTFPVTNINYINYQATDIQSVDIDNLNGSFEIDRLLLSDGDADGTANDVDGASTRLIFLRVAIRDAADVTTMRHIKRMALYNSGASGATEIAEVPVTGTDITNGYVDFSALNIIAPDNGTATISIRVSFNNTVSTILDKTLLRVRIEDAVVGGGSQFYTLGVAPVIAGAPNGGYAAPTNKNFVNVIATKLDFTGQPNAFSGINEFTVGQLSARDPNNLLDLDWNNGVIITAPTATVNGTFTFINGVLDIPGKLTYGSVGDGTLSATSVGLSTSTVGPFACNHIDVIHITTVRNDGGAGAVPPSPTANLLAGASNRVLFGFKFKSDYSISSPADHPTISNFTISFSQSISGIFQNFRVFESTTGIYSGSIDVTTGGVTGTVTPGANSILVSFATARDLFLNPNLSYFLVADVNINVNGSTPTIKPSIIDAGSGPTAANIIASVGTQLSNTDGPTYSFASVAPPTLVSSYPPVAATNVDIGQNAIELSFSVPVISLDNKIRLYDKAANTFIVLTSSNPTPPAGAQPLIFNIPPGSLSANREYYVTIVPGDLTAPGAGIADVNSNLFPGISYSGTLFFRTASTIPPKLLGANTLAYAGVNATDPIVTDITNSGATLNATFDKAGKAYFMVCSTNNPTPPTNAQIKGALYVANTVVARGSFDVNSTTTVSQFGTITPTSGSFTAGTHYVWIYAESYAEKNHILPPTAIPTLAPYGGSAVSFAEITGPTDGPTLDFLAVGPPPALPLTDISTNNANIIICSNSAQIINTPIIIYEGTNTGQSFSLAPTSTGPQTMNLVLPAGFQFDITSINPSTGLPYGKVTVQGTDFSGPGILSYLSTSVARITYTNNTTASRDKIILSDFRIISTGSVSGNIFRLGGTAMPAVTDGKAVAFLSAQDAVVIDFDNSYSQNLVPPSVLPSPVETAIPDNLPNPLVTLTPYVSNLAFDFGASTFSGPGININTLNVNGVTLDVPFNIVITHKDQNGCISQNPVQYVVYNHDRAVNITNPLISRPLIPVTLDQGPYCVTNPQFVIGATNNMTAPNGTVRDVKYDNLNAYRMFDLTAAIPFTPPSAPVTTPAGTLTFPVISASNFSGAWLPIISGLPFKKLPAAANVSGIDYFDFNFDDKKIVNAHAINGAIPYIYDIFKKTTSANPNYPGPQTFYTGGSLGTVEFTGYFRNNSNPVVIIKRRQIVEFVLPAVPLVELVTRSSDLIVPAIPSTNPNDPGILIYCEGGGLININGWPQADPARGKIGVFKIYDNLSNALIPGGTAFKDNTNGTATLDPSVITNTYKDIRIEYEYEDQAASATGTGMCKTIGTQVIRITPNPVATFTRKSAASPFVEPTSIPFPNAFCENQPVNFDATGSTVTGGGAIIKSYTWDFKDATNSTGANPNTILNGIPGAPAVTGASGPPYAAGTSETPNHTFIQSGNYSPSVVITSNFNCNSPAFALAVKVGGVPVVGIDFRGVHAGPAVADEFTFWSNNSTISSNDHFQKFDWDYGDGTLVTYNPAGAPSTARDLLFNDPAAGPPINPKTNLSVPFKHNYLASAVGQQIYNLTVTTEIGCRNSLSLTNTVQKGITVADDKLLRTLLVLPRFVTSTTTAYLETFEGTPAPTQIWQPWYTGAFVPAPVAPAIVPIKSIDATWVRGVPTKNATAITPNPWPLSPNGSTIWTTSLGGTYNPGERSAIYSPSFDLSLLQRPMISFDTFTQLENADGVVLQYSVDDKNIVDPTKAWKVLGTTTDGEFWYTDKGIAAKPGDQVGNDYGWSQKTSTGWINSKHALVELVGPAPGTPTIITAPRTVFRLALASAATQIDGTGFGVDNMRIGERTRTILLENFVNTGNTTKSATTPSTPINHPSDEEFENGFIAGYSSANVGLEVVKLSYHLNFPGNDPFNSDNMADPSARALFYNIEQTPAARLDGYFPPPTYKPFSIWGDLAFNTRTLHLAQASILIKPVGSGTPSTITSSGKVSFMIDVTPTVDLDTKTILHVGVVEQLVPKGSLSSTNQSLITTGETQFEYVVKKLLPTASGTRTSTAVGPAATAGVLKSGITYHFGPFEWKPEASRFYAPSLADLGVIAFLQREDGDKEVYQAEIEKDLDDAPANLITGLEPIQAEDIIVYPVPANQQMHIELPGILEQPARIQMVDQMGRVPLEDSMAKGASSKTISTIDLSAGVYILQIDVGNGNIARKKIIIVH